MRFKRKDTQLLVENWRKLLKGEELPDAVNEGMLGDIRDKVTGKKAVLVLLKDKIDSKLAELKAQIDASSQSLNKDQTMNGYELTKITIEKNIDKIIDGQVLLYLKSCISDENIEASKRVKKEVFEKVFQEIFSGSESIVNKDLKNRVQEVQELARTLVDLSEEQGKNKENVRRYKKSALLEEPWGWNNNVQKIKDIGKTIADLCNKR